MILLSACNTAVGENGEGAEIAGLAYQFEMRGAKAVVASLWRVSDDSTSALMAQFYFALRKRKSTRIDSLRSAQLKLLESEHWNHPYYLAPFLLIGDWH